MVLRFGWYNFLLLGVDNKRTKQKFLKTKNVLSKDTSDLNH